MTENKPIFKMECRELGEKLILTAQAISAPKADEVTIEIKACGVNFADTLMVKGQYQEKPSLPLTPGMEVAGIITAIGDAVHDFKIGDRVAGFASSGGFANQINLNERLVSHLSETVSYDQAAASLIAYGTGLMALRDRAHLKKGERLLVTGATGGVGSTAVEIGRLLGAEIIGTARHDKLELAREFGCDHVFDSDDPELANKLKSLGGVDVVYDAIGGDTFKAALRAINPLGRLIPIGFASGHVPQIPANILLVKNVDVIGFYFGGYLKFAPQAFKATVATVIDWLAEQKISTKISHKYALEDANLALEALRDRKAEGKVIITMEP